MNVLVTGGAGYIGAHCCQELAARGFRPVVFDNLSTGHREFVRWGEFCEGDIRDADRLDAACARFRIEAVLHFAAFIEVGESVADPLKYYANNVAGSLELMRAMARHGIRPIVFSSSAAVYGEPRQLNGRRLILNPGSVGQPRDGDPRACYAILTDETITFRRLEYDVETTIRKIYDEPKWTGYDVVLDVFPHAQHPTASLLRRHLDRHAAVLAGEQVRQEEGGLGEVLPRRRGRRERLLAA